jgi:hypothetical protein
MDFNAEPYWDDFEATNGALEKNYMRILFKPGFAVQARELTQIQSILQNQVKQFGNHIFQDGSPVIGGHLTLDTAVNYVKLDKQYNGVDIDLENFYGVTVFNTGSPKTRAKVIQTYSNTTDRTLMVKYIRGAGFTAGQTLTTAATNSANVTATSPTGVGSTVSINDGVFYVDGYFVSVAADTIVLDPYSATPSYRVGLQIEESIVTSSDDAALLDPAQESFNYQAPGADRYQYNLVLAKRTLDSVDDRRFFELLRVENGVITRQVSYPIYSELEKTFARRTYDESGNYAVKPFRINISANTPAGLSENTETFIINVEPGKAYVKGFEFETIGTTKIPSTRARNTKSSKDYDLSVYYGNRLQLANVLGSANGIVFSEGLNEVDIHSTVNNAVTFGSGSAAYYSTRIGTAKLKNFDRTSDSVLYYSYLTDINFTPIISTANGTSANTLSVNFPAHFSSNANAYLGGTITLLDTTGAVGNSGKIINYNTTTKVAVLDTAFKAIPANGDRFNLTLPLGAAKSIIIANTSSFAAANLQANVSDVSKDGTGNTVIEDANYDKMLFELPNYYIKYNSDVNVDLYRRYVSKGVSFATNGAATVTVTGQTFDFGTDGATVSSADVRENIIVVPTTGANVGKILDMTASPRSVYRTSNTQISLYTDSGSGTSFTGDVYLTTKVANANGSFRRQKTLVSSNSALTAGDTLSSATAVSGYSEVKLNASNGIAWFTTSNVVNNIPGQKQSLFISDVISINKIYDSANLSHAPNTTNMVDITDRYTFDSGQTENFYNHASITLKPGAQPPRGQTAVLFDYFTHSGTGYLSGFSYGTTLYNSEQIPLFKASSGKVYNLRDCIDLRPIRASGISVAPYAYANANARVNVSSGGYTVTANTALTSNVLTPPITTGTMIRVGNDIRVVNGVSNLTSVSVNKAFSAAVTNGTIEIVTQNMSFSGSILQRPTDPMQLDYDYYLPRIDKVVVTKDKEFKVLNGVPSLSPQEPFVGDDSMPIYTMYIPPYTASLRSIELNYIDNRRYTMKDISALDTRINNIENYVALKESESQIISDPPKSPTTPLINKPIYGTIVDEFNDLSIADQTTDFAASIESGLLGCYKYITPFTLKPANNNNVRDKFVTLGYTETPIATQKLATADGTQRVQSAMIAKYDGFLTLTPESDYFYSLEHQPLITDSIGKNYEVIQEVGYDDAALTASYLTAIGAAGYSSSDLSSLLSVTGYYQPASSITYRVSVPAYSVAPTSNEPTSTIQVGINGAGVMPMQGVFGRIEPIKLTLDRNYSTSWNYQSSLSPVISNSLL